MRLSLTMIVRNEEATLARALAQARKVCEEIIVVDTGSTDRSIEIAEHYGAKVFHFDWVDDFSLARNYALDQATGDLILWLDADDVIPDITLAGIDRLKQILADPHYSEYEAVMIPYHYVFDLAGRPAFIIRSARIFRRDPALRWQYAVHEHVPVSRTITVDEIWIEHRPVEGLELSKSDRNIRILQQAIAQGESRSPMVLALAQHLQSQGDLAKAVDLYRLLIEREESQHLTFEALLGLTRCRAQMQDDAIVSEYAQRAIDVMPQRPAAYLELANYHMRHGDPAQAIPLLETVLQLPVDHSLLYVLPHNNRVYPLTLLSECYERLGNFPLAIEYKRASIHDHPDPVSAQKELQALLQLEGSTPHDETPLPQHDIRTIPHNATTDGPSPRA